MDILQTVLSSTVVLVKGASWAPVYTHLGKCVCQWFLISLASVSVYIMELKLTLTQLSSLTMSPGVPQPRMKLNSKSLSML